MNTSIKTDLPKEKIINILKENVLHHSPVLNSRHIKSVKTDKKLCGYNDENSFLIWKTLNKKAVIVPILKGEVENGVISIHGELPIQNKYMLIFWYVLLSLYILLNVAYIPFSYDKLIYLVNIVVGIAVLFISLFLVKRTFKKRFNKTIEVLEELLS